MGSASSVRSTLARHEAALPRFQFSVVSGQFRTFPANTNNAFVAVMSVGLCTEGHADSTWGRAWQDIRRLFRAAAREQNAAVSRHFWHTSSYFQVRNTTKPTGLYVVPNKSVFIVVETTTTRGDKATERTNTLMAPRSDSAV
ncbi:unnamed protein product [Ectocarpus fasciculatus]